MESIESKIRLLYNKKSKEMTIVVSDVEEGNETYAEVRKLVKNLIEIELKKVIGGTEELNLEKAEDITPMPATSIPIAPAAFIKAVTTEATSVATTEVPPVEAEEAPVEAKEEPAPTANEAPAETTTVESPEEEVLTPMSDDPTFLIKAGDTQLSVKDFAEANRLFQPKFMTGGKFRVAPNEIAIYEKAGYAHP